jgi:hypothetical protein
MMVVHELMKNLGMGESAMQASCRATDASTILKSQGGLCASETRHI